MQSGCIKATSSSQQSHPGCGCGGNSRGQNMWSKKKKIRFLEAQLEEIDEQKTNIEELVEELKDKS